MELTNEHVNQFSQLVHKIGNEFSNRYRMVDRQDIYQEVWLWFITHPNKFASWYQMENQKEATKLFARSLRNAALAFCIREKARIEGYSPDDNFYYSKDFIKELLPAVLSDDVKRIQKTLDSGSKTAKDLSESGDWMAFAADIRQAFSKLSDQDQRLVYLFYAEEITGSELHVQTNSDRPSVRADMMAANRALGKMVKFLGGYKPFEDRDEVINDMSEVQGSGESERAEKPEWESEAIGPGDS